MGARSDSPEHECRQGRKCKARLRDDEDRWHGAGVEDAGTLCRPCEEHAFGAIRQLHNDYRQLIPARVEIRSHISGPKVSGSSERPIPIRLGPDTLMSDIDIETLRWTLRITGGDPLPAADSGRVHRCVEILSANLGTLIGLPTRIVPAWLPHPDGGDTDGLDALDGVDAVLRLAQLHHRAMVMLGLIETTTWLTEACHMCGLRTLTMSIEHSLISCRSCRNVWDQDEFARLNNPMMAA